VLRAELLLLNIERSQLKCFGHVQTAGDPLADQGMLETVCTLAVGKLLSMLLETLEEVANDTEVWVAALGMLPGWMKTGDLAMRN